MTTLADVSAASAPYAVAWCSVERARMERDGRIRACYAGGNATQRDLAKATGLTPQRIHQIVKGDAR